MSNNANGNRQVIFFPVLLGTKVIISSYEPSISLQVPRAIPKCFSKL